MAMKGNSELDTKTGIFRGIQRAEYETIDAMNISTLINGVKSMAHLKQYMSERREMTDALRIGIAVHIAVFEPSKTDSMFFVAPKRARRSNEDKAWWAEFEAKAQAESGIVLSEDEAATVFKMRDSLRACKPVREILDAQGVGEMAVVWKDEETGILCKGLVDRFCDWMGWPLIPDLKTCQDASKDAFAKDVAKFHYGTKASWYVDGLNSIHKCERRFVWIAIEKSLPHAVAMYEPDFQTMEEGRKVYRRLLNQYAEAKKTGIFPSYPEGIEPITLPKWAFEKEECA